MGFGFVVARFGLFLQEFRLVQHTQLAQSSGPSLWFGTGLISVGVIVNVFAGWHHIRLVRALNRGETEHAHLSLQPVSMAFFLALVGLAMTVYLVSVRSFTRVHLEHSEETSMTTVPTN